MKKLIILLVSALSLINVWSQNSNVNKETKEIILPMDDSKSYCTSTYTNTTDDWITNVTFNTINNTTEQDGPNSYASYTWGLPTGLFVGQTYNLSVSFFSSGTYTQHVWAWIDWNQDEDFNDAGEAYDLGQGIDATLTIPITVPYAATVGSTRLRIIEQYNTDPSPCDPHNNVYGETEDYTLLVSSNNYCFAQGGGDEYIESVGFYHSTGITTMGNYNAGYYDWYDWGWFDLPKNGALFIEITNGNPYAADQCGIWIDWNKDNDFNDPGETLSVTGSPGIGPYTAFIYPPAGAALTDYHLRTRIVYNQTPNPCGATTYGEVEDFHITIVPEITAEWIGWEDNNWHNPLNWSTVKVPDASTDVIIHDYDMEKCWVYAGTANCNNITVEYGSGNDLRIYDQQLHVYGDMAMYGQLLMDHVDGEILAEGNVDWYSGSRASIQANTVFWVYGDWNFRPGADVTLNNGIVDFAGSGANFIRSYESNCYFNDIGVYKSGSNWLSISNASTDDLHIHGSIYIQPNCVMYMYTPVNVFLQGDLFNAGSFLGETGTLVFNGTTQLISENLSYSTTQYFNNLTINSSNSTTISNKNITIKGNLKIETGNFIANDYNITVAKNWQNQGTGTFVPGNGRVIFNGASNTNFYGDENFNILELNKSGNQLLNIDGPAITCQQYDWNSGGSISVRVGGEFTAYDLIDNGIYGGWGVDNTGGTINIYNYDGYVDLNGSISMTGGVMNIYGGTSISYWPYAADATIYLLWDGTVDFHDQGIYIYDSPTYTLNENITGGTIKTAGGFWGEHANFSPDYGTVEFYGSDDATIYTINSCSLNDVIINKSAKDESKSNNSSSSPIIDIRSGKIISDGSKSNTLQQIEFLDINGSLTIESGVLHSNSYNIQIEGDWTNNVGEAGFIESTGWVIFDGYSKVATLHTNETFNNLMLSNASSGVFGLTFMDGIVVNVNDKLDLQWSTLEMNQSSELNIGGDIFIATGAGLNVDDGYNIVSVGGNWTNENSTNTQYQGYWKGGEVVTFNGIGDQIISTNASEEKFGNLVIDKTGGYFKPDDDIKIDGSLHIIQGDWWDNSIGLNHYFVGNVQIEATGNYFPLGSTNFVGFNTQTYQNNGGSAVFEDVVIDKTGTLILNSDMVVFNNHETTIEEGTLDLNGQTLKSTGNIYVEDGGTLLADEGSTLYLVSNLKVMSGGEFITTGLPGNNVLVTCDVAGDYQIEVYGGTISSSYTNYTELSTPGPGIWVYSMATVDPSNAFNHCSFIASGNDLVTLLAIDTDQDLTIDGAEFPILPTGSSITNVAKNQNQGSLTFTNVSGDFAGPLYENDFYDRIHWPDFVPGLWKGTISSDWFDPLNWGDQHVPDITTDVVIPLGTPNEPAINNTVASCNSSNVESGASLEIGNNQLTVGATIQIYGELIMNNASGILNSDAIIWQPGSFADVTAGEIHVNSWYFEDGTNAQLGTGNTAFITSTIGPYDADATFGNLEILPSKGGGIPESKGTYPVRVDGYCAVISGKSWYTGDDWIINGEWTIDDGAGFNVVLNAVVECHSALILNGDLNISENSEVWIHGILTFPSTGSLTINEGLFMCDYNLSSGWIDLYGDIQLSLGSLEFPNANISFAGTSIISGGTIIAGRTVHADLPGAFQPTGGKLELVGSGIGHYLQIRNGNYINELHVNRSDPIGIHPGSPLAIQGPSVIFSELMVQGNTLSFYDDIDISAGGILSLDDNAVLQIADNKWLAVNSGGTINAVGSLGNEATITHTSGHYNFWIGDEATISAEHAILEYMGIDGINLNYGSVVDPVYSFNNCVFQNGATGGNLITIDNIQDFTINNAEFPSNTWGSVYNVYKAATSGNVTLMDATGDFAGEAYEYDPNNLVHWGTPEIRLELKVFLEGPFNGISMNTELNSILPLNSPFNPPLPYFGNSMPDWYYASGGTVGFIPDPSVVDWVLVQLRDATSPGTALPATNIATTPAFVLNDGNIIATDGSPYLTFTLTPINDLYVVIWHRNHLGVISASPISESGGFYSYDFSSDAGQAYGGANAQVQLSSTPLIWGMISGDGNGDGEVLSSDKSNVWNIQSGTKGYLESDYNLNGQSDNIDKNDTWLTNEGKGSAIPE